MALETLLQVLSFYIEDRSDTELKDEACRRGQRLSRKSNEAKRSECEHFPSGCYDAGRKRVEGHARPSFNAAQQQSSFEAKVWIHCTVRLHRKTLQQRKLELRLISELRCLSRLLGVKRVCKCRQSARRSRNLCQLSQALCSALYLTLSHCTTHSILRSNAEALESGEDDGS